MRRSSLRSTSCSSQRSRADSVERRGAQVTVSERVFERCHGFSITRMRSAFRTVVNRWAMTTRVQFKAAGCSCTQPAVLLLDEATSALDAETERRGAIIERGTHAELLALGGRYAHLVGLPSAAVGQGAALGERQRGRIAGSEA